MDNAPVFVSLVFILTTFLAVGIFFYAAKRGAFSSAATKTLSFLFPFWLIFQAVVALNGFYLQTYSFPPRLFLFGILPTLLLIITLFVFARKNFIALLPLKTLTALHVVRIPVEIVLLVLFQAGQVPRLMTFEGRNFDILSGITAPVISWLAFRAGKINRPLLIVWNFIALGLLANIVINALLSVPSPIQRFAFDQPNRAILYFPFVWLPTVVVPVVLFCHLASLWNVFSNDKIKT